MSRFDARYKLVLLLAACAMALGLSACGGVGSSDINQMTSNSTNSAGRVALMFTDAPTTDFQHINVTVMEVQLLGPEGPQSLYSGEKTFDLLALNSHAEMFSLADIAPGVYDKIRLLVADVELVRQDASGAVIERIHPKLPGNGMLDLNPRAPFVVAAGQTLYLQLDMDAAKSIHIVETGSGKYIFRPVIFVNVLGAESPGKVVRLRGDIEDVDLVAQHFLVCHPELAPRRIKGKEGNHGTDTGHEDDDGLIPQGTTTNTAAPAPTCVEVQAGDGTALFDAHGDPAQLSDVMAGDQVTVLGRFTLRTDNGRWLEFRAAVIELGPGGTYAQLQGEVASVAADHSSFVLNLSPGQGFVPGTALQVTVQGGTKIFTRQGTELSPADIETGDRVTVEGVVVLSDTEADRIKAAIVFVDADAINGPITGTLGQIDTTRNGFILATAGGDRCVTLAMGANIFEISETPTGFVSEAVALSQLESGQRVDVYGPLGLGGCYIAHDVLAAAP